MKIAYITSGAAGMYCGSCMRDNTLVRALQQQGHDALLIPTYTPVRTDEENVSLPRVFFGGINVYLQQKSALFRHTPWFLDRVFDSPMLLRWASQFAVKTEAKDLGDLTLSMLQGEHGKQRKEIQKLVAWLEKDVRPDVINLSNVLIAGMAPEFKRRLGVPIVATLQGDDIFLESLPEQHRAEAIRLIHERCAAIDGLISTSRYYADFMAGYLGIDRSKVDVVYPGLDLAKHAGQASPAKDDHFTIGYFARISPEKGFHLIVEAFHRLRLSGIDCRLRASGYLGANQQAFFDGIQTQIKDWGLSADFEHVDSPDHASKVRFLQSIDVLSVPTVYQEPKGLYVLEAWANGIPVVQPRHGSFPELIEATGGGVLFEPENVDDLVRSLTSLIQDRARAKMLGEAGRDAVKKRFTAEVMAEETLKVYRKYVKGSA